MYVFRVTCFFFNLLATCYLSSPSQEREQHSILGKKGIASFHRHVQIRAGPQPAS